MSYMDLFDINIVENFSLGLGPKFHHQIVRMTGTSSCVTSVFLMLSSGSDLDPKGDCAGKQGV